ncbi:MAG TPA: hypothetical protein VIV40_23930 [Kofleriaceae bacterium]
MGPEQVRIDQIERALPTPETLGGVLPEAMAHASQLRGDELSTAMAKPLTGALRDVARRQPGLFGEILAPTIGTAVRRAISEALAMMLQRMNELLERGLSVRSLRWRLESKRTGRSYAEVVLAHTLIYRVEWAVLIHTETSVVLEQATAPDTLPRAPDQITAMLQAIGSFVSEAFQPTSPGADLHALQVGDISLWIERDPAVTLALAIRGTPPLELREILRQTLERVRTLHHEDFADHVPEVVRFADTHPLLEDCLRQQVKPRPKRAQQFLAILAAAIAITIVVFSYRASARDQRGAQLHAAYEATLSNAAGIVITKLERVGGGFHIEGLRDPRAEPIPLILARAGLAPVVDTELAAFESRDPRLASPFEGLDAAIRELERIQIMFPRGTAGVVAADRSVGRAAELVNRARRAAAGNGLGLCVEIIGDSDETGSPATNERLRSKRARGVGEALRASGVAGDILDAHAADPTQSSHNRYVTFRALLRPGTGPQRCQP